MKRIKTALFVLAERIKLTEGLIDCAGSNVLVHAAADYSAANFPSYKSALSLPSAYFNKLLSSFTAAVEPPQRKWSTGIVRKAEDH